MEISVNTFIDVAYTCMYILELRDKYLSTHNFAMYRCIYLCWDY